MLLPLAFCIYHREPDTLAFIVSTIISLVCGVLLWRSTRLPAPVKTLSVREGLAIVALSWIAAAAFSALPYFISGTLPSYLDALFEAVAGYTTTGATVYSGLENQPHGILLWRSLTQWLGGMGIIMFFVAFFPIVGIGAAKLVSAETPGQEEGRLTTRIRDTFKVLLLVYIGLTIGEFALLNVAGMPSFDAVTVSLSTMATGGFAPSDASIAAYNSAPVEGIIIFFMIAAGVNFGLYYLAIWKRKPGVFLKSSEFKLYIAVLVVATLAINIDLVVNMGLPVFEALRQSSFQSVSLVTTTGFATADFNTWPTFARSAALMLVVVGASAGSTGGALKVIRLLVVVKYAYRRLLKVLNPSRVVLLKVDGKLVPDGVVNNVMGLVIIYFAAIWFGFLVMSALGLDFETAISSVTSCIGNVGPGLGLVGPASNYFLIPILGKVMLIVYMLAGRMEIFALSAIVVPAFWKWT
jgi:trk system potassium uptake protein TrkH